MKSPETTRTLTEFQELVCDLAGDLILNGGHQRDVLRLISAVIGHCWRRRLTTLSESTIQSDIQKHRKEWRDRLGRHWPKKAHSQEPAEPPKTVSEMMRENLRGNVWSQFENFMGNAHMHELYLLAGVLDRFENNTGGPAHDEAQSVLANAFMDEIGSNRTYVRVPSDHLEAVEEYIRQLQTIIPEGDAEDDELAKLWALNAGEASGGNGAV